MGLSLSSLYFGGFNGFSGQIMFNEWAYQLYNIVFTCLPILLYAVIDRDHTDEYLIAHPSLYWQSQSSQLFNAKVFFTWIADSLLASCLLVLIPIHCYEYMTSPDATGQSSGIWTVGMVTLTSIVFTANIRLTLITNSWIWITHFFFWGSMLAFFVSLIVLNLSSVFARAGSDYYWLFFRVAGTPRFWLTVLLTVVIALFAPFTYVSFTSLRQRAQNIESQHHATTHRFNAIAKKKKRKKIHAGKSDDSSSSKEPLKSNPY